MKIFTVLFASLFTLFSCHPVMAEPQYIDVPEEIYTTDGARNLVLTVKDCPLEDNYGYTKYAYIEIVAGLNLDAEACWQVTDKGEYDVWVPKDSKSYVIPSTAFAPRGKTKRIEVLPEPTL